ncbi:hypothetical protein SLS62_006747 [Diatrype stigma]|uniref:Protein kinase domain-containing protein n=1 Tax=Diatrype stigma TaxID=117547 RepID=A0AAN9YNV9_9PEZI
MSGSGGNSGNGGNGGSGGGSGSGSGSGNGSAASNFVERNKPQNFEEEVRAENFRFEQYRLHGTGPYGPTEYAYMRDEWMARPFPRVGHGTPAIRSGKVAVSREQQILRGRKMPSLLGNSPHDNDPGFVRARTRFHEAKNWFLTQGPFDFVRPLGYGGLGLTIQFKTRDATPMNIVLKIALEGWVDEDIGQERKATRQLARAAHCIQLIDPASVGLQQEKYKFVMPDQYDSSAAEGSSSGEESRDDAPPPPGPTRRAQLADPVMRKKILDRRKRRREQTARCNEALEIRDSLLEQRARGVELMAGNVARFQLDYKDYLLLEFAENGDLEKFIIKMNERDLMAPNRVLYPPRKFHPRRREKPNTGEPLATEIASLSLDNDRDQVGKIINGDLVEDVPGPRRRWAGKRMVHFDIDPRNVFLAGFGVDAADDEHTLAPRLKLADFGVAMNVKPNKSNAYYQNKRFQAKEGYFAPEQFGIDWDYVAPKEPIGWELSEQPVAGNYGAPMNVWGIALTLWNVITKLRPPIPPQRQNSSMLDPSEPLTYCHLLLTTDARFRYVDPELKQVLQQCLRHDPKDRPSLLALLRQAKRGITKTFPDEPDEAIRTWMHNLLYNA